MIGSWTSLVNNAGGTTLDGSRGIRGLRVAPARTICQHVAHKLRLQFLRASFSADVEGPFQNGEFFVPWRKMHHRKAVITKRTPHDPPSVTRTLHHPAIGPGATKERTGDLHDIFRHGEWTYYFDCSAV
jgi:hypothetical protein